MSDLIRREDALAVLCFSQETGQMVCGDLRKLLEEIKAIPSAEPERTAKFRRDGDFLRCSKCWRIVDSGYNYCPNCGAKLDWSE